MVEGTVSRRYIIIEFNRFHDEVLFPQINALERYQCTYRVLANRELLKNGLLQEGSNVIALNSGGIIAKLHNVMRALLYVRKSDIVILNSADWKLSQIFLFFSCSRNIFSIVHNGKRLCSRPFRRIKKKSRTIIVLNDYISNALKHYDIETRSYYPLLPKEIFHTENYERSDHTVISIPGVIAFSKRDYHAVLLWALNEKDMLCGRYKIELLGNIRSKDGMVIREFIEEHNLEDIFIVHEGFIPYKNFIRRITAADYLLPLTNPEVYGTLKITAVFNYAIGFDKPLLLQKGFKKITGIYCRKIYYESLQTLLNSLSKSDTDYSDDRKDRDYQREYIEILNNNTSE